MRFYLFPSPASNPSVQFINQSTEKYHSGDLSEKDMVNLKPRREMRNFIMLSIKWLHTNEPTMHSGVEENI